MGQDISKSINPPPLTLQDCFVDGKFDLARYLYYSRRMDEIDNQFYNNFSNLISKKRKYESIEHSSNVKKDHTRSVKKHKLLVRNSDGSLRELRPEDTIWYLIYVSNPPNSDRMLKLFRNRFRIPYSYFIDLANEISNHDLFSRWRCKDAVGTSPSNIKLLLLGSLRYLGRSWTFDDVSESNGISREVNRVFFLHFIEYGTTVLYKKHVIDAAKSLNISEQESLFRLAGFNGCIGSADATHVIMLKCASWASLSHKGFKLNLPARSYNLTVSHTKQILCSTTGHPSTWNDKTLVLFDPLLSGVHEGDLYNNFEFCLFEKNDSNEIVEVKYKGVWFMVDNGYLNWSCTVPPVKNAMSYQTIRFSEWLESMRKDVECTFGILKQRFSILRHGIRLESIKNCDEVWMTCCGLHNVLLKLDGYDKNWSTTNGENDIHNVSNHDSPFSINRLNRIIEGNDVDNCEVVNSSLFEEYIEDGYRIVSKMPLELFRQCLVNHFHIRFKMKSVFWPLHTNKNKPSDIEPNFD